MSPLEECTRLNESVLTQIRCNERATNPRGLSMSSECVRDGGCFVSARERQAFNVTSSPPGGVQERPVTVRPLGRKRANPDLVEESQFLSLLETHLSRGVYGFHPCALRGSGRCLARRCGYALSGRWKIIATLRMMSVLRRTGVRTYW